MIYVYDMILNWIDGDKVYEFFEWELSDNIEHIKRIPLFKVDTKLFDEISCYDFEVDQDFLSKIYNLTEQYTNDKIEKIKYATIFTDGVRATAIEFDDNGLSTFRSRLLLDEEQDVIILSNKLSCYELNIVEKRKKNDDMFTTRLEQNIKKMLTIEINDTYKKGNFDKLKYLYFEFFGKEQDDMDVMHKNLLSSIEKEINYNHNKLYEVIKLSYQNKS